MKAHELLKRLPELVTERASESPNAIIQYDISEPMYQIIENGQLSIHEGKAATPSLTISLADEDLVSLFKGDLNPMMAFMSGKIKLKGDLMLAQKLLGFIDKDKVSRLS